MGPPGTATKQQPSSSPTNHSSSSLNGLKFGQKIYFEDVGVLSSTTPATSSAGPKKGRGGGSVSPALPPRCQVEGCNADLSDAKAYYSRHKVCAMHSKSPSVLVAGLQQRFCQQCSRFHQLPEFDQGKRSCRRRLAGHNERRRKPAPSSLLTSRYSRLSSSIFDNSGKSGSFLMGFASYPKLSLRTSLPHPSSSEPLSWQWQGYSEAPSEFFLQGSMGGTSFRGPRHPPQPGGGVADSSCALSLLSSQAWGSSNTAPSLGLNNMWNFNSTPMTQLAASSNHAPIHQLPNTSCCFKGVDPDSCSTNALPDLGRGQISLQLHGELDDVPQPGRRNYMDPGQSETYESPQWSL